RGRFALPSPHGAPQALAATGRGARVAVVGLTIFPVTLGLGATLPTLSHALATAETVGRRGGSLYALNTVGGACGIAVMGFGLPAAIGVRTSYLAAASANALAGLVALWVGDAPQPPPPQAATPKARPS